MTKSTDDEGFYEALANRLTDPTVELQTSNGLTGEAAAAEGRELLEGTTIPAWQTSLATERNPELALDNESRVAIAGDWHRNVSWAQTVIPALVRIGPDIRTILHLGDFGIWPGREGKGFLRSVDRSCAGAGIERVFVTPGNHEDWGRLHGLFASRPHRVLQLSEMVWVLPRGFRFTLAGTSFLSFGGAASVDFEDRVPGLTWWISEIPTEADVEAAIVGGPIDVLLTHEAVNGGTAQVEKVLRANPGGWPAQALSYSSVSRARVTRVWDAVRPEVLAHGHMHLQGEIRLADGRRVYSLAADTQAGNMGILDLRTRRWDWLPLDRHGRQGAPQP
ncbi:metallophosphoesterase [Diaminobutyricimonas sp. LJ205]|uniref:metallophosphoesterase family protein n=1 Tax=Diaminobutyricimonas sp. LJ205 TaxID=2683590 RepID=UPI0012F4B4B7|nr:metallophosphoesterase [Diaminobutyricimonas sp. LJ205]